MKHEWDPGRLDVRAFARAAGQLQGVTPLTAWPRLAEDAVHTDGQVHWSLIGSTRPVMGGADQVWLTLTAQLNMALTCQRCLLPVTCPLQVERAFRFVADEALAAQEDEASQEDVLVWNNALDALELIEDELIMALPMIPMHEACDGERAPTSGDLASSDEKRPHPFAVLSKLRSDKTG